MRIEDLKLGVRATNCCLVNLECKTVEDLLKLSTTEVRRVSGVGEKTLAEIIFGLREAGFKRGIASAEVDDLNSLRRREIELLRQLNLVRQRIAEAEKSKTSREESRQRDNRMELMLSMIEKGMTIKEAAHYFGVSRTPIQKLISSRLYRMKNHT